MPKLTSKQKREILRAASLMSQLAITAITCVVGGVFLGIFLDGRLGTSPWLVIVFSLLGCFSGLKMMVDIAKKV